MRITFSSSVRDMTYNYHLKQQLPMCEIIFIQFLAKNPRPFNRLNRFSINSYTTKFTNREIIFVNERN